MKNFIFSFLGILFFSICGTSVFAALNPAVSLPPTLKKGDMVTETGWNNIRSGMQTLDIRTAEIVSNSGNVGIGVATPTEKLDVLGHGKFSGKVFSSATLATDIVETLTTKGYVDELFGTVKAFAKVDLPNCTEEQVLKSDGTQFLCIADIDTKLSEADILALGFIKTFTETDPKVGTNATNFLSKWNGSNLTSSGVFEDLGNVGIGTTTPLYSLDITGTLRFTGDSSAPTPVDEDDIATKAYADSAKDNLGNHTAITNLNMADKRIVAVSAPVANTDAANKAYVDSVVAAAGENSTTNNISGGGLLTCVSGKDGADIKGFVKYVGGSNTCYLLDSVANDGALCKPWEDWRGSSCIAKNIIADVLCDSGYKYYMSTDEFINNNCIPLTNSSAGKGGCIPGYEPNELVLKTENDKFKIFSICIEKSGDSSNLNTSLFSLSSKIGDNIPDFGKGNIYTLANNHNGKMTFHSEEKKLIPQQVSAGSNHTCAVLSDGTIQCWGAGQALGNGESVSTKNPVTVAGIFNAVSVSAGTNNTCAVLSDGTAKCWGSNNYGQLGNGGTENTNIPVTVSEISNVLSISSRLSSTCAVLSDGTVKCWGLGTSGQLGDGTIVSKSTPVTVSGISNAISISQGDYHACAVLNDGTVKCWGQGSYGKLGDGTTVSKSTPVTVTGISNAISVSAGAHHTCALLSDGTVQCWGLGTSGQIGDGTSANKSTPVTVSGISNAVSVFTGDNHTCAVLSDGTVQCWGLGTSGQIGDGTSANKSTPVTVSGISNAVSISANNHTCALLSTGTIQCWGQGTSGQLGDEGVSNRTSPVVVQRGFVSILYTIPQQVSSGENHTCAVLSDGTVQCWGLGTSGQIGDGTSANKSTPVTVSGISNAVSVSSGASHTCAVLSDRNIKCWGQGGSGEMGNGEAVPNSTTPLGVIGISNAVSVSAGNNHTCAVLNDGNIKCWGAGTGGKLGNGLNLTSSTTPVVVSGISNAVSVSAGSHHTCAVLTNGNIKCWGQGSIGQMGNGETIQNNYAPVGVIGISNAVSVSAGAHHTCAVLSDGTVQCWGQGTSGELGEGGATYSVVPVTVTGISNAVSVSSGLSYTCAVLSDGTPKCWGSGASGKLGDGKSKNSFTPVAVTGISNAVSVSAGLGNHTCGILKDKNIQCWGLGTSGQLGQNGSSSTTPVEVFRNRWHETLDTIIPLFLTNTKYCAYSEKDDNNVLCWNK